MRYENFTKKDSFYIYCRGVSGSRVFIDDEDVARFIFLITHLQSPVRVYNISWYAKGFLKKKVFSTQKEKLSQILKERSVELLAFAITPKEADILLTNLEEGALSVYMQRVLTSYAKYFNSKYKRSGHVFDGPFKATRVVKNEDVLRISADIHKKPGTGVQSKNYTEYSYSSYLDYTETNRWGELLYTDQIMRYFKNQSEYKNFVEKTDTESPK